MHATTAPPGRVTRAISPTPAAGSLMNWTTSCARAAANVSSGNGSCSAEPSRTSAPGLRARARLDERLRRIDRGDGVGADAGDELRGERARPAAHVDHPLPGCDPGQIGELRREQHGVPSHEPVVRIGRDVEGHAGNYADR